MESTSILWVAANPKDTDALGLQEEREEIIKVLSSATFRDKIDFNTAVAATTGKVTSELLKVKPHILQFSGHGTREGDIVLEDEQGATKVVYLEDFANLLSAFKSQLRCAILNACRSRELAEAISQHINYVIAVKYRIGDPEAILFSTGFYKALGEGQCIEFAYRYGLHEIGINGWEGYLDRTIFIRDRKIIPNEEILEHYPVNASIHNMSNSGVRENEIGTPNNQDYGLLDNINFYRVYGCNCAPRLQRAIHNAVQKFRKIKPTWIKECLDFLDVDKHTEELIVDCSPGQLFNFRFYSFYQKLFFAGFTIFLTGSFMLPGNLAWASMIVTTLSFGFCLVSSYMMRPYTLAMKIKNELNN